MNVDTKDIPVRLLQRAWNIGTSRITTFLELLNETFRIRADLQKQLR